ncbi:CpsD/CapB family tyrosine-protein kinase [Ureibacillus chungkukjangi]|uniref:CpsD/CapB family tyrosine-protein kinase n=1 Tax=Ureibacillus chungkukjangi TaxID=1202712 RepID=UPI00255A1304|nr:CpsD/CapB family tyrosine-protein kinase [Ureibacillus chungkukjangi]
MFNKKKRKLKKQAKMPRTLITISDNNSLISEQFRTIRANINFSMPGEELKTILITSPSPGEGKSTNAANIAVVFAQEGKRVLLVDADLRKPTLHYTFNLKNLTGLTHILVGKYFLFNVIQESPIAGLHLLPSGPIPPNPSELLASSNMDNFLEEVKKKYDLIIFDAPPIISVSDSQILGNKCDGTLLVVNSGISEKKDFLKSEEILVASKARIIGAVLNNYKMPKDHYQNYYAYSN